MSALVDQLVAQVIGLEVGLLSCQARLAAVTDDEALHDLRTTVRRLRSLLRPCVGYRVSSSWNWPPARSAN